VTSIAPTPPWLLPYARQGCDGRHYPVESCALCLPFPLPLRRQNEPLRVQPWGQVARSGIASWEPARGMQTDPEDV
jgi:hypothetical protein